MLLIDVATAFTELDEGIENPTGFCASVCPIPRLGIL
jgi:hypothetical protein